MGSKRKFGRLARRKLLASRLSRSLETLLVGYALKPMNFFSGGANPCLPRVSTSTRLCSVGHLLRQLLGLSTNIVQITNHVEGGLGEVIELSGEDGLGDVGRQ